MIQTRTLVFLLVWAPVCWCVLGDTPAEEMQRFIDECNEAVDMFQRCANGWENLEQEMIDSVDSFADRIVFTEGLILQEADLILDMADKIVETSEIVESLIISCNCSSSSSSSTVKYWDSQRLPEKVADSVHVDEAKQSSVDSKNITTPGSLSISIDHNSITPTKDATAASNSSSANNVEFDRCTAMDEIITVMDACIDTFETFNTDFLDVLSYMNLAIQAMGDRIVDTECLIVNMSYQILDMADRIVETEQLMENMAEECCKVGGGGKGSTDTASRTLSLTKQRIAERKGHWKSVSAMALPRTRNPEDENDDLMKDCNNLPPSFQSSGESFSSKDLLKVDLQKVGQMLEIALTNFQSSMAERVGAWSEKVLSATSTGNHSFMLFVEKVQVQQRRQEEEEEQQQQQSSSFKMSLDIDSSAPDGEEDDGGESLMPCDTWWDPFCCAAEVCADMMAAMIEAMGGGADVAVDICESCIDEIGKLADDIVVTENYIIQMGYEIGYMADCIVVFIEEGLEFMTLFCPNGDVNSTASAKLQYLRLGTSTLASPSGKSGDEGSCSSTASSLMSLQHMMQDSPSSRESGNDRQNNKSRAVLTEKMARFNAISESMTVFSKTILPNMLSSLPASATKKSLKLSDNPFGEFAEMVEVCVEMVQVCTDMMSSQFTLLNSLLSNINDLAAEQSTMNGMAQDLGDDVTTVSTEVSEEEQAMDYLTDCME